MQNTYKTLQAVVPLHSAIPDYPTASLRAPILLGFGAILFLFVVFGTWSSLAPLASATIAVGSVVVENNRKVVQHLEGGIVQTVSVNDGDHVTAGEELIRLDDSRLVSAIQSLKSLLAINIIQRARLEAERKGAESITFQDTQDGIALGEFEQAQVEQTRNFQARRSALSNRIRLLEVEQHQLEATLAGLHQQMETSEIRLALVMQDMRVAADLASSGIGTRQRVRDVAKSVAEQRGERDSFLTRIAETEQKITRTIVEADRTRATFTESVEAEIQQTNRDHLDLLDRYRSISDQLRRTRIEAPVSGRIVNLVVHTNGGVVGPGMPLLEIVPDEDRLLIEVQVRPADADAIAPDLPVRIRVHGTEAHRLPFLFGSVLSISADRILDRQGATPYFLVRITIPMEELKRLKQTVLKPGLSVEVMITKGEKTVIEYLVSPLLNFFANALHE